MTTNLFTIIKYSDVDLTNFDALKALPEELLTLYWNEVKFVNHYLTHDDRCNYLVAYALMKPSDNREALYKSALEKYSQNESV